MADADLSIEALLAKDYDEIHLAEVRLKKGDPPEYLRGRIVDRYQRDLKLRVKGREYSVPQADEWELLRFQPVTSRAERMLVEGDMR